MALHLAERRILLAAGDLLALALTAGCAMWVRSAHIGDAFGAEGSNIGHLVWLSLLVLLWMVLAAVNSCYDARFALRSLVIARQLLATFTEAGVVYVALFFVFGRPIFGASGTPLSGGQPILDTAPFAPPRLTALVFLAFAATAVIAWRLIYARLFSATALRRRLLVVGAGKAGRSLARELRKAVTDTFVVAFVDDDSQLAGAYVEGLPVIGGADRLVTGARDHGADEIVVAITTEISETLSKTLLECYERGFQVRSMPDVFADVLGRVPVMYLGRKSFPDLLTATVALPNVQRFVKRVIDIIVAVFGLLVLVAVIPPIALAIILDSGFPVFYGQERLGRAGRRFRLLKFRSMHNDAEKDGAAVWASQADPRITRVGSFLRATRLDELPQFLNVLVGDMSIVGPRPERPQLVDGLSSEIPLYRARLSVKPGLSGWAQINHGYGNTLADAVIKLQYDLYYIKRQTLWLDLLVILRTIKVMLSMKGT